MTSKIFKSILVVAAFVFAATVVFAISVIYTYYSNTEKEQLAEQAELIAIGVNESGIDYIDKLEADGYRVTWIASDGTVKYDSRADSDKMTDHSTREEVKEALQDGKGESSRYSMTMLEKEIYVAERLEDGTVIRLSTTQPTLSGLFLGILNQLIVVTFLTLLLAFFLAYRLSKRITRPLDEMDLDDKETIPYEELRPLVDKRQEKEEQIRKEFTANVTHELKTPLQTISGSAELLSKGFVKPDDQQDFYDRIYMESRRLITLVDDIINLSKLEEKGLELSKEQVNLYEIVQTTVNKLKPVADRSGTEIRFEGEPVEMKGVPQLLESIAFNLVDNAIKYSGDNGHVKVTISRQNNRAVLKVEDDGIGIADKEKERIFERFYRVDKSRSKEVGGTGLGLSIVKHAAMIHGAEISLESMLGKGTTVEVQFPLDDISMKK